MNDIANFTKKSLLGGVLIGFGCIANTMMEDKLVGSFLFSLGLLTVIIMEANLYTGKVGYAKLELSHWLYYLIPMLLSNIVGIGITCTLFSKYFSGLDLDTSALMDAKHCETIGEAFIRSVGCGVMMFIAVEGYKRIKNPLIVILPVMCFILSGFDHCIANYGYMAMNAENFNWQLPIWVIGNSTGSICLKALIDV